MHTNDIQMKEGTDIRVQTYSVHVVTTKATVRKACSRARSVPSGFCLRAVENFNIGTKKPKRNKVQKKQTEKEEQRDLHDRLELQQPSCIRKTTVFASQCDQSIGQALGNSETTKKRSLHLTITPNQNSPASTTTKEKPRFNPLHSTKKKRKKETQCQRARARDSSEPGKWKLEWLGHQGVIVMEMMDAENR